MSQFDATTQNVDEAILNNMGSLSQVIGNAKYQSGSPDQLPEGVNLSGVGDPNAPQDIAPYLGNVAESGVSGVTPQQAPGAGPDPAEYQRLQQIAYDASLARIEAEEQAFESSIQHLSEYEQQAYRLQRENEQTREVNEWLNQKLQQQEQSVQNQQQQQNKQKWMMLAATQAGLPLSNPGVVTALSKAQNVNELYSIANGLVQLVGQGQSTAAVNTLNNGILSPGGRPAPSAPAGPKRGSGDISGLISSRGSVSVNMG